MNEYWKNTIGIMAAVVPGMTLAMHAYSTGVLQLGVFTIAGVIATLAGTAALLIWNSDNYGKSESGASA